MLSGNKTSQNTILKRMEFVYQNQSFKFLLNPESYTHTQPGRVTTTKTKGGFYLETFGQDVSELEISGVTGFKNGTNNPESGYQQFKALESIITSVFNSVKDGSEVKDVLSFYNYTDNEYLLTYPTKFQLSRSKSQPNLYRYTINLVILGLLGQSFASSEIQTIGRLGIENTYPNTVASSRGKHSSY